MPAGVLENDDHELDTKPFILPVDHLNGGVCYLTDCDENKDI